VAVAQPISSQWLVAADVRVGDLDAVVRTSTRFDDYPHAKAVQSGVLVYDGDAVRARLAQPDGEHALRAELARALLDGPGVVVFERAFPDVSVVDRVTDVFRALIDEQHAAGTESGDHFAAPGANDRVWNALEKLALRDPVAFVDYYANEIIALAALAWLGPGYQVTSQVNVVNPGGQAQAPHRDYHLGFQSDEAAARYPAHVHLLSTVLTLQGAVAHSDMPVASGPTMLLPHSHKYPLGYLAWRQPAVGTYFLEHQVQLPLNQGDAIFFNPAVLHAAGTNSSRDVHRMANLLQVSSAFGRAMESIDRSSMCIGVYPALVAAGHLDAVQVRNVIAACAEGYAFPTNLDLDQPVGGLAPPSQADVLRRALAERWSAGELAEALVGHAARRRSA
jgi:ectoine hydroxylase-related dioxygenase (phytanoyl-CoA dioxygenase family)